MNASALTITNLIIGITCVVSFLLMQSREGKTQLIFHPVTIREHNQWYRFISSGLIHADFMHLAINMLVLWSFGTAIETFYYPKFLGEFSSLQYLMLYFGGIAIASCPSYLRHNRNPKYAALGASGGVSAVVFAVIIFDPWRNLYLWGVIAIPQILAGLAYLYYSWYKDKMASDNIGHMAHFSGAVWGFLFTGLMNFDLFARFVQKTLQGPNWF
ncbi:MAG: rhomboid family intramembrane serine protease [Gammaproteobacteria bacterium]|nr:rhomboid family intramembrane serine protease [Gammaproteobacteria bacterium]